MWSNLGKYFLNGLIALLPIAITLWFLWVVFSFLDGILGPIVYGIIGFTIPGLGLLAGVALLILTGWFTTYIFGKRLFGLGERILRSLPFVNTVYASVKQISDLLFLQAETRAFRQVCAVEYPRKGIYSIGFVTGRGVYQLEESIGEELVNVFIPTSPTPATGFMMAFPKKEVKILDMSLEDALKLIVSGGVLRPPKPAKGGEEK